MSNKSGRTVKYSIVIPVFNQVRYTMACLEMISDTCPLDEVEIIVSNNGSTDGTSALLDTIISGNNKTFGKEFPLTVIDNGENIGYGGGANRGMEASTGEYILIINNDIEGFKGWVEYLSFTLKSARKKIKGKKVGMVGPVSNYVGGNQQEPLPQDFNYDEFRSWAEGRKRTMGAESGSVEIAGFLSGFCLMISRECMEDVGLFDERFNPGGFEDNDYILRAQEKGWTAIIDRTNYIFHYGSRTFEGEKETLGEQNRGMNNRGKFYDKWVVPKEKKMKLVAMCRVKNGVIAKLEDMLDKTMEFADGIVIINDGSTDDTGKICQKKKYESFILDYVFQTPNTEFDERRDRNRLIQMAKKFDPDWLISVDADEVFEDSFNRDVVERLMRPANPHIKAYGFHWSTFWRGTQECRVDGIWGNIAGMRMYKSEPNQEIVLGTDKGFHCGNMPHTAQFNARMTQFRIKHYGYWDYEELCKKKFEFYVTMDENPNPIFVGNSSYSHLVEEFGKVTVPWVEDNSISLVCMGKNIGSKFYDFYDMHSAIFDEFVFVDTGSEDNTKEIALSLGCKVFDYKWIDHFADARNFCIDKTTKRWVLVLDFDEELENGTYSIRRRIEYLDIKAYLVSVLNLQKNGYIAPTEVVRLWQKDKDIKFYRRVHETLDVSLREMKAKHGDRFKVTIPNDFRIVHRGFLDPKHHHKLDYYSRLNHEAIEDNEDDAIPWYNIALEHINDDEWDEAEKCFQEAMSRDGSFVQPRNDLAYLFLKKARKLFKICTTMYPDGHYSHTKCKNDVDALDRMIGPEIKV